jgi:hypothetical protein
MQPRNAFSPLGSLVAATPRHRDLTPERISM